MSDVLGMGTDAFVIALLTLIYLEMGRPTRDERWRRNVHLVCLTIVALVLTWLRR